MLVATYEIEEADAVEAIVHVIEEACAILDDGLEGMATTWEQLVVDIRLARADKISVSLVVREKDSITRAESSGAWSIA